MSRPEILLGISYITYVGDRQRDSKKKRQRDRQTNRKNEADRKKKRIKEARFE